MFWCWADVCLASRNVPPVTAAVLEFRSGKTFCVVSLVFFPLLIRLSCSFLSAETSSLPFLCFTLLLSLVQTLSQTGTQSCGKSPCKFRLWVINQWSMLAWSDWTSAPCHRKKHEPKAPSWINKHMKDPGHPLSSDVYMSERLKMNRHVLTASSLWINKDEHGWWSYQENIVLLGIRSTSSPLLSCQPRWWKAHYFVLGS